MRGINKKSVFGIEYYLPDERKMRCIKGKVIFGFWEYRIDKNEKVLKLKLKFVRSCYFSILNGEKLMMISLRGD